MSSPCQPAIDVPLTFDDINGLRKGGFRFYDYASDGYERHLVSLQRGVSMGAVVESSSRADSGGGY